MNNNFKKIKTMRKNLFILAAAALALASCSSDETTAVNDSVANANEINFRPLVNGVTRAAVTSYGDMSGGFNTGNTINVYADFNGSKYFQEDFEKQNGSTFTSTNKYYWPSDISNSKKMTFWAIYGATQKTDDPGVIETFLPATAAASQVDVLLAKEESDAAKTSTGQVLNFRHLLSMIDVKVKNTNPRLKITVYGARIGYVATTGAFDYNRDIDNDGIKDVGPLTTSQSSDNVNYKKWTLTAVTDANTNKYDQYYNGSDGTNGLSASVALVGNTSDTNHDLGTGWKPWIILPQAISPATAYTTTGTSGDDPKLNNAYIALLMEVENYNGSAATGTIVAKQWCYWPLAAVTWTPGYKYTYIVDTANGGYHPADRDTNTDLDPVLPDVIVFSASCTIDAWDTADGSYVSVP